MSASEFDCLMPTTPASTRHEDRKDEGKESGGNKVKREPEDQRRGIQEERGLRTVHRLHICARDSLASTIESQCKCCCLHLSPLSPRGATYRRRVRLTHLWISKA